MPLVQVVKPIIFVNQNRIVVAKGPTTLMDSIFEILYCPFMAVEFSKNFSRVHFSFGSDAIQLERKPKSHDGIGLLVELKGRDFKKKWKS